MNNVLVIVFTIFAFSGWILFFSVVFKKTEKSNIDFNDILPIVHRKGFIVDMSEPVDLGTLNQNEENKEI